MFTEMSAAAFTERLASGAPVPGGGGASALVGAVGAALNRMVGNLTVGKKKFVDVEDKIRGLMDRAQQLQECLLALVDEDAAAFEPLSRAYGIPKEDPKRDEVMEDALRTANGVPLEIMRCCAEAIRLHGETAQKCSALAISDIGVGVLCCKAGLMGASLNVFINTKYMKDRAFAEQLEREADELLSTYCAQADEIYASVAEKLR